MYDKTTFVGIDPGKNGAIAIIRGKHVDTHKMPATERDMSDLFEALTIEDDVVILIEKVNAMPMDAKKAIWTFSGNYHSLRMAMICHKLPFNEVLPRGWQQAMGIPPKKKSHTKTMHKNNLKAKAQQLFPHLTVTLTIADALLIAEHCRRTVQNTGASLSPGLGAEQSSTEE